VEVESTIPPAKGGIAGFEGREGHRTPFAPTVIIHSNGDRRYPPSGSAAGSSFVLKKNRAGCIATRSVSPQIGCEGMCYCSGVPVPESQLGADLCSRLRLSDPERVRAGRVQAQRSRQGAVIEAGPPA